MNSPLVSTGGTIFIIIYLLSLIVIGLIGRYFRKEESMSDFYLAGRGMGMFVLFLTLYATQYSGNTLIGFAGKAYRNGFTALVTVTFMCSVIGAYFIFAPKLFRLSRKYSFITIGDFIQFRYKSTALTIIVSVLSIIALVNYIVTNLKAMGIIIESVTGGTVSFINGIILLSLIMVIYETLGGMRSVAWTDMIQGILLLVGVVFIFGLVQDNYGGVIASQIQYNRDFWNPPDWNEKRLWFSTIIILFAGISVYPHAIQRIYSAKSETTLKRSLQIMVFMPFVTTLFIIFVGIIGAVQFPDLSTKESEYITLLILSDLSEKVPSIAPILILFISAAIAAIMSTVDSALLAISSITTQDIYRRIRPQTNEKSLTYFGKVFSWVLISIAAVFAIYLPQTIWRLMEIKLELLCQIAPAILIGIHLKQLDKSIILSGLTVGTFIALLIILSNMFGLQVPSKPWGIHAGVWGLTANCIIIFILYQRKIRTKS
ncbi:MAG: sodium:pantothenate symporter [Candidatus Marinimicrobia bacterium]|nr:sodium:pantothenate symporter [Candidatus Neomarinimicrobiota bacterium]|tara:strand:+ start:33610 stop:35067 length:1458 start_codon:yes stop_codon:yes gene_type:complete